MILTLLNTNLLCRIISLYYKILMFWTSREWNLNVMRPSTIFLVPLQPLVRKNGLKIHHILFFYTLPTICLAFHFPFFAPFLLHLLFLSVQWIASTFKQKKYFIKFWVPSLWLINFIFQNSIALLDWQYQHTQSLIH